MGEYYMYLNLDRKEYLDIDFLGGETKAFGLGRNLGARALGLLLMHGVGHDEHPLIGSWAGTRVVALGDYAKPNLFGIQTVSAEEPKWNLYDLATESYKNIGSAAAVMLLEHDGPDELVGVAKQEDDVFVILGELATVHLKLAEAALNRYWGEGWKETYSERRKKQALPIPPP